MRCLGDHDSRTDWEICGPLPCSLAVSHTGPARVACRPKVQLAGGTHGKQALDGYLEVLELGFSETLGRKLGIIYLEAAMIRCDDGSFLWPFL